MKFTVNRAAFVSAVHGAAQIVDRTTTIELFRSALLTIEDNNLTVAATDSQVHISTACGMDLESEPGSLAVNAKLLLDAVRTFDGDELTLSVDKSKRLTVASSDGSATMVLPGIDGRDFSPLYQAPEEAFVPVDGAKFAAAIKRVAWAAGVDSTRNNLFGIAVLSGRLAATDGHRMAFASSPLTTVDCPTVVLSKAANATAALFAEAGDDDECEVAFTVDHFSARCGGAEITTRTGVNPPLLDQVVPKHKLQVTVDRTALLAAARRCQGVAQVVKEQTLDTVKLEYSDGVLALSLSNPSRGDAMTKLATDAPKGSVSLYIAARYLVDAIEAIDGERVVLELGKRLDPFVFRPVNDETHFNLCMPRS